MDTLLRTLANWKPLTALVVGDFMLDQLVYGNAERLAPDSPVPVLHVRRTESVPGGAGNLCRDLAAMRGRVIAVGVTGKDAEAKILREALSTEGIDASGLVACGDRPTTVKRNLIGLAQHRHPQKMFRVDYESCEALDGVVRGRLIASIAEAMGVADVVCVEDYGKGVCDGEVCRVTIEAAKRAGKPVFVDPCAGADYRKYEGASAITPNRTEAEAATGLRSTDDPESAGAMARRLAEVTRCEAVVITLDRHGALLLERGGEPTLVPASAREVYDVTGAGDMFLAGLAAARGNGASWSDAVRLANAAAGLEVEVFGVAPMPIERIHREVLRLAGRLDGKVRDLSQLMLEVEGVRSRGGRIVFTNGCFDILHAGHIALLERAAGFGDFLIVAVNDDDSIRRLKGPGRPVNTAADRTRVLGALSSVDAVIVFGEDTPIPLLERIRPDVLVKGADYSRSEVVGGDLVESWGGRVELVEAVPGRSTTGIIERLAKR